MPFIYMPAGSMLRGNVKGKILVCRTPGNTGRAPRRQDQPGAMARVEGGAGAATSLMTMGTASTMTGIAEAMGLTLPARRRFPPSRTTYPHGHECGRRIVGMVWEDLTPAKILSPRSRTPSPSAWPWLLDQRHHSPGRHVAPCRRAPNGLDDFDVASRKVLRQHPTERRHLPDEDFYYAGGMLGMMMS
jgi:dihydroxy-acid dehydratase